MYAGEVNVSQADLPAFLKTAERLKVKGLAEVNQNERQDRWFEVSKFLKDLFK